MKKQVLFIHSAGPQGPHEGSSDIVAWLREELGSSFEVRFPLMPAPESPQYHPWMQQLDSELRASEDGVLLVGHSLGGSVALKYLAEESCPRRIGGLLLVAAPYWGTPDWEVEEFCLPDHFPTLLPPLPFLALYHSREDAFVPFAHAELYAERLRQATLHALDGDDHVFAAGLPALAADLRRL